jgi:hypothetical protein
MAGGANHRRIRRKRALVGQRKDPVEEATRQNLVTARVSLDNAHAFIDAFSVTSVVRQFSWIFLATPKSPHHVALDNHFPAPNMEA